MLYERRAALGVVAPLSFEYPSPMWCSRCQQDVPAAFAPGAQGKATSARCGRGVGLATCPSSTDEPMRVDRTGDAPCVKSMFDFSDWKLEDDLREAQRLVRLIQSQCDEPEPRATTEQDETRPRRRRQRFSRPTSTGGSFLGWMLLGLGLSGLVCGCALLVWSHISGRSELWNIGLPIALVSQAVLACGAILQYDGGAKRAVEGREEDDERPAPATHLHVNTGGGMQASGLSVHFSSNPQQAAAPNTRQIQRQVEAAMRRRAA